MGILKKEPSIIQFDTKSKNSDFVVVGDLHGSLEFYLRIFEKMKHCKQPHNEPRFIRNKIQSFHFCKSGNES